MTKPSNRFQRLKASMAVGLSLSVTVSTYAGCSDGPTTTGGGNGGTGLVTDPVPPDGGSSSSGEGGMVVDPPPPDGGFGGFGGAGGEGGMVVDPLPVDGGEMGLLDIEPEPVRPPTKLRLIDQWFDTSPKTAVRTVDLPLFDPPKLKLVARREDGLVHVRLEGANCAVSTRWEGDGFLRGDGIEAEWRPTGPMDRVRVGIRSRGGVAILSLRADGVTDVV